MPTNSTGGSSVVPLDPPPPDPRLAVNRCLTALWPLLLAASAAADGPAPRSAATHLRAAARLLATVAGRL
jgi:hypothetical protein